MMNIKAARKAGFRIAVTIIAIVISVSASLRMLQSGANLNVLGSVKSQNESIYKTIIDKTVPMLYVSMDNESGGKMEFIPYTIIRYITSIDFKNPKTYLSKQIPLLGIFGDFESAGFKANVGGALSQNKGSEQTNTPVPTGIASRSSNFGDEKPVDKTKIDHSKPAVILYHTHTTESYTPTALNSYEMMGDHRTTDRDYNVCKIGEEIKNYIETYYGFAVEHDMTLHDYPSYDGSYGRSKKTIENLIKKYPDAKLIIDVHRDAFADDEAARKMMVADVRGDKAGKVMLVIGKSNPHWQENYQRASKLNQKIEQLFPGITRSIDIKANSIYNQDISNKILLVEVGAECNTMEEALISAKMVAKAIGETLKNN